ncbi:CGNR zinc finger domain-containing protein [Fodinicola acaciae]|uniref:CGNR zinc finger domain-containing protein n=1 Tax=Fodinicola acaciae TaxID=2681555 RepID=UPI0013D246F6|nr:CGNR zinc finger domain-containing protein [Fodinicola acaciae]
MDAAPGRLEVVRTFLNTWVIPNESRVAEDRLAGLVADPAAWRSTFPDLGKPGPLADLTALRDDLRAALGQTHPVSLAGQLARHPLAPALRADGRPVELAPVSAGAAGELLALAINAAADGHWHRLRACPDCRWVFYDTSRNASRTWCAMNSGGPGVRGCGSIAKTRAYRARKH